MKDLEEQRVCVKFCLKLGKKNLYRDFTDVATGLWGGLFEPYAMLRVVSAFKSGRTSIKDDPKSGQPSSSTGDDHIEKVRSVIRENRRLTIREVSKEVGICKSSCHTILTEDALCCHKICAASADRGTKTEPRLSQSGAIRSFEY